MSGFDKEKEFENAIVEYGGIITKICYYFSSDTDEFKDLRQEVLYNIWKGWDKFRNDSKLSTWIYRVSFNTCVSYNRKEIKRKNTLSIDDVLDIPEETELSKLEKYNAMHKLIQQLVYEERAIILLWLDEKPYEEIAELMGLPRNTVAVKLKRIKEKLVKMSKEG
ncbi:MAG: sigma-70 family RNA polymerase sigma factor [Muribaculaceae bacterium]|nr:sigma-70 family RNA polymerase sigma factor [Muribaculaceae bacterium]